MLTFPPHPLLLTQTSPLTYPTPSNPSVYATLLEGKSISFTSTSEEEDWKTVTIGDGMRILSVREVCPNHSGSWQ